MVARFLIRLAATLMVGLGGAGCAPPASGPPGTSAGGPPLPVVAPDGRPAPALPATTDADAALLDFVAGAAPGDQVELRQAGTEPDLMVVMERAYHAASGKDCRRFRMVGGGRAPATRFACRDRLGVWRLLPPLQGGRPPAGSARGIARVPVI